MFGASLVTVANTLAIRPVMRRTSAATRVLARSEAVVAEEFVAEEFVAEELVAEELVAEELVAEELVAGERIA
jgi:hypothetical protein